MRDFKTLMNELPPELKDRLNKLPPEAKEAMEKFVGNLTTSTPEKQTQTLAEVGIRVALVAPGIHMDMRFDVIWQGLNLLQASYLQGFLKEILKAEDTNLRKLLLISYDFNAEQGSKADDRFRLLVSEIAKTAQHATKEKTSQGS